ncbi:MAG: DMT family transporter [Hyphomicrobium sp.]
MTNWLPWLALTVCVIANIASNIVLKTLSQQAPQSLDMKTAVAIIWNPMLWLALVLTGIVFVSYFLAIRFLPLGAAYPMSTGLTAIGVTIAGSRFFGEPVSLASLAGIALVVAGIAILSRTVP